MFVALRASDPTAKRLKTSNNPKKAKRKPITRTESVKLTADAFEIDFETVLNALTGDAPPGAESTGVGFTESALDFSKIVKGMNTTTRRNHAKTRFWLRGREKKPDDGEPKKPKKDPAQPALAGGSGGSKKKRDKKDKEKVKKSTSKKSAQKKKRLSWMRGDDLKIKKLPPNPEAANKSLPKSLSSEDVHEEKIGFSGGLCVERSLTPGRLSSASTSSNLVAVNISSSPSPRIINLSGITTPRSPRYKTNRSSLHLEKDPLKSKSVFGDRNDVRYYFQKMLQSQSQSINFVFDMDGFIDYIKMNNIQTPEELYSKRNENSCPQKDNSQFWALFKSYQRNQQTVEDLNKVSNENIHSQISDTITSTDIKVEVDSKEGSQREKNKKSKAKESKSEYSESDTTESANEPEFTRLSSLAKLAASISLISLDISDDKSGSESFDVSSEEINDLDNIGELLLPSEGEWNILPGTFVELKGRLGKGATATVYSGIIENRIVAIKQIKLSAYSQGIKYAQATIQREYQIVKELCHPNILRYYGLFFNKENQQVNLIMELVDGVPLTDFVIYVGHVNEEFTAYILRFVLDALGFLHSHGIMHRDIKPDNVLMSMSATIKLIDFGTATKYTPNINRRNSTVGTPWYCAPEVINGEAYDTECDVWSLGCFAVELVSGKPPFDELNEIACLYKMAEGQSPPLPDGISPACASFLSSCFTSDWKKRPTVKELSASPFISSQIPLENEHKEGITKIITEMTHVKAQHLFRKLTKNTQQNFQL